MKFHALVASMASARTALGASLQPVRDFGANPTGIQMYFYVPDKLPKSAPIIVGLHPCGGAATSWYSKTLAASADAGGFILIYPGTTRFERCWDVNNPGSLSHGGTGDATGIVSAVKYAIQQHDGDPTRVFVYGGSSGAMMTNVLAGAYPDVFTAAAVYSGTPFACFLGAENPPSPSGRNQSCAQGRVTHTPDQWANFVRNAHPGYTGPRTRMLVAHGAADTLVRPALAYEQLKQWSAVLGLESTKNLTGGPGVPNTYTRLLYGDGTKLIGYMGVGVGHFAPTIEPVRFPASPCYVSVDEY